MLIAIAGSQGTGKSTLISGACSRLGIPSITRKTSRSILSDWNVTLSEVNNDRELTLKFQDEILKRKMEDEQIAANSDAIWLTERTYADLFTYSVVALGKDNHYSDWLDDYFERCKAAQSSYSAIIYLPGGFFRPVHDGVRGTNLHYSRMVDLMLEEYTMTHMPCASSINPTKIHSPNIDDRLSAVDDVIHLITNREIATHV